MLFFRSGVLGKGLGKKLLNFALTELGDDRIDVNEQNTHAAKYYRRSGFEVSERMDTDDQGRPNPLLRMRLSSGVN
jgi:putative acetyltransferase